MKVKHFINLSNGIEQIPKLTEDYSFIRIQSTACEQKRWVFILDDLDNNFLMSLALGYICVIHDRSANHKVSRALWQGIPWIEYVLNRIWFNKIIKPLVRSFVCDKYFSDNFKSLPKTTKKRLKFYKKFLLTDEIRILPMCRGTNNDGNYVYFKSLLEDEIKKEIKCIHYMN